MTDMLDMTSTGGHSGGKLWAEQDTDTCLAKLAFSNISMTFNEKLRCTIDLSYKHSEIAQ